MGMKLEYSQMEFDPTVKSLWKTYPKLKDILGEIEERSARYILLMYDKNSPLKDAYPDIEKRKMFAADIAGFDPDIDKEVIEELRTFSRRKKLEGGDIAVNEKGELIIIPTDDLLECLTKYLIHQSNRVWAMIVANESAFYEYHRKVMTEVTDGGDKDVLQAVTIKTKLMESMDDIDKRLQGYYRELSGNDRTLEESLTKRKKISAESQAVR
mgnify:CR=1 FL=1